MGWSGKKDIEDHHVQVPNFIICMLLPTVHLGLDKMNIFASNGYCILSFSLFPLLVSFVSNISIFLCGSICAPHPNLIFRTDLEWYL